MGAHLRCSPKSKLAGDVPRAGKELSHHVQAKRHLEPRALEPERIGEVEHTSMNVRTSATRTEAGTSERLIPSRSAPPGSGSITCHCTQARRRVSTTRRAMAGDSGERERWGRRTGIELFTASRGHNLRCARIRGTGASVQGEQRGGEELRRMHGQSQVELVVVVVSPTRSGAVGLRTARTAARTGTAVACTRPLE